MNPATTLTFFYLGKIRFSPAKVEKRLPELLTDHELVGFYDVWHARNPTRMIFGEALSIEKFSKQNSLQIYTECNNIDLHSV